MVIIRSSRVPADVKFDSGSDADPLREQVVQVLAEEPAPNRVSTVRMIRAQLHVGQPRAATAGLSCHSRARHDENLAA